MSTEEPDPFPMFLPRVQDGPAQFDDQVERVLGMSREDCDMVVTRVAWRLTGNEHDARDLSQKTWEKILSYLFEEPKGRGWLVRIITNQFLDDKRKRTDSVAPTHDLTESLEFTNYEEQVLALVTVGKNSPHDTRRVLEAVERLVAEYAAHVQDPEHKLIADHLFNFGEGRFNSHAAIAAVTKLSKSKVQRTIPRMMVELRVILAPVRDELESLRLGLPFVQNDQPEPEPDTDDDAARTA